MNKTIEEKPSSEEFESNPIAEGSSWEVYRQGDSDDPPEGCGWEPFAVTVHPLVGLDGEPDETIWWRRKL